MDLSFMAAQVRRSSSNLSEDVWLVPTFYYICPSISWAWPVNKFMWRFDNCTVSIRLNTNQDVYHHKFSFLNWKINVYFHNTANGT